VDNIKKVSGFINSKEIDELLSDNAEVNGGTTAPCSIIGTVLSTIGLIYTTRTASACPTSACTKSC